MDKILIRVVDPITQRRILRLREIMFKELGVTLSTNMIGIAVMLAGLNHLESEYDLKPLESQRPTRPPKKAQEKPLTRRSKKK